MAVSIVTYSHLATLLRSRPPACGQVRVVAVDGPSGAGKTTFARRLARAVERVPEPGGPAAECPEPGGSVAECAGSVAEYAGATAEYAPVVGSDDFPVPWDGDPLAWQAPFRAAVLAPLAAGRSARLRRYDWRRDAYTGAEEIPPTPVLLVEGVGAARAAGAGASYVVWIDAPHSVRRGRVRDREGEDVLARWDRWNAREQRHFAAERTRERADLVVDGASPAPHDLEHEFVVAA